MIIILDTNNNNDKFKHISQIVVSSESVRQTFDALE